VLPRDGATLQVNDLRFGLLGDTLSGNNYVFPFLLFKNAQGEWDVVQDRRAQQDPEKGKVSMQALWERVQGK
jgi:hypothetical protein